MDYRKTDEYEEIVYHDKYNPWHRHGIAALVGLIVAVPMYIKGSKSTNYLVKNSIGIDSLLAGLIIYGLVQFIYAEIIFPPERYPAKTYIGVGEIVPENKEFNSIRVRLNAVQFEKDGKWTLYASSRAGDYDVIDDHRIYISLQEYDKGPKEIKNYDGVKLRNLKTDSIVTFYADS